METAENRNYPQSVDLTNCDKEPIHLLGNVQQFGCFIALRADWLIAYCSANTEEYFGCIPDELIGDGIKNWLDKETLHHVRSGLQSSMITGRNERLFNLRIAKTSIPVEVSIHHNGEFIILEFEKIDKQNDSSEHFVRSLLSQFYRATDSADLIDMVAQQLRLITHYDRVMVYRFLPDGAGEVIAESREPDLEAFLGLRYPASDIPKQARALYVKNLLRVIGNVNEDVIPIVPAMGKRAQPLDLSFSTLRAVSPIHIEYLKNMGVDASMSVSIIINGKLWGLFACHHYSPKVPSYFQRTELELFAEVFALELSSRLIAEQDKEKNRVRGVHNRMMATMSSQGSLIDSIVQQFDTLQDLISSEGIAVLVDGQYQGHGTTLPTDILSRLTRYLNTQAPSEVIALDSIGDVMAEYDTAVHNIAGVLAIPISKSPRDYLLFYRQAQTQTIKWAGNPEKPVKLGPSGSRLLPRTSFEIWRETHNDRCHEWSEQDLRDGESIRVTLLEVMIRHVQERDDIRQQASRKHEILISELNHRVRNILNLVNAIVMQTEQSNRSIQEFVSVLTGRLVALASAHDQLTASQWSDISFTQLINTEIQAYIDVDARVHLEGEEVMIKPEAATSIVLVMHELFTNAAKYGALSTSLKKGEVHIQWHQDPSAGLIIEWKEQGGPPVVPSNREGFGMTLIRSVIPHELDGQVDVEFAPHGVQAKMVVPQRHISDCQKLPHVEEALSVDLTASTPSLPREALVVEDSLVIALDMQKKLKDIGIEQVSVAGNIRSAEQLIAKRQPGLVVFDVHLGRETTFGLLQNVLGQGIPCIIISGYGEELTLPAEFTAVPVLTKPVATQAVIEVIYTLFGTAN
ncbi:GAF domain-containing protein [Alteromonas pelagimontana]|uniref:histidine kinase n=1 Tax=Alteromonas pelagimontana TaxID=1858656 RepID=A0A6M4M8F1_9ALTE|nr:HWE histidine kinase domain-containing protein [Alteromonas pelagimontana]QJR79501.1 GAF domain-containing protein [Alteromonas pelagimontana]